MKKAVFFSYATKDRDYAESLKKRLREILSAKSQPPEIFDIQSDMVAGGDVRKAIKDAMDAAKTVVIVSSPNSDDSEWVNYEAGLADALGKKLVFVGGSGMGKSKLVDRFRDHPKVVIETDGAWPLELADKL